MSDLTCPACGKDLTEQGQWLRCRAHFVTDLKAAVARAEAADRMNERFRAVLDRIANGVPGSIAADLAEEVLDSFGLGHPFIDEPWGTP